MKSLVAGALAVTAVATGIKLMLLPAYRSTDFEVHRNWLAITHSLPISKWYIDSTSPWTLDYPPIFAWFEWVLSHVAVWFDPSMLVVQNLGYASFNTVLFQRLSVMLTDLVYISAALMFSRKIAAAHGQRRGLLLFVLLTCNAGLLLVDHIHFQYNGVLMGVLMWSVYLMHEGQDWLSGVAFTVLINMKHLFVYCGPLFYIQISRHWCGSGVTGWVRWLIMGGTVAAICAASFGPFVAMGQSLQLAARMFPFGRGLTHAYWAGNAWALYTGADKVLAALLPSLAAPVDGLHVDPARGQVGVAQMRILPHIEPEVAFLLVLAALAPAAVSLYKRPQPQRFAGAIAYACLCAFWLGYHVHEKAIITVLVPLALPAVTSPTAAEDFIVLSCAGHYGLLPLLFNEYPIKLLLVVLYYLVAAHGLADIHFSSSAEKDKPEAVSNLGAPPPGPRLPFERKESSGNLGSPGGAPSPPPPPTSLGPNSANLAGMRGPSPLGFSGALNTSGPGSPLTAANPPGSPFTVDASGHVSGIGSAGGTGGTATPVAGKSAADAPAPTFAPLPPTFHNKVSSLSGKLTAQAGPTSGGAAADSGPASGPLSRMHAESLTRHNSESRDSVGALLVDRERDRPSGGGLIHRAAVKAAAQAAAQSLAQAGAPGAQPSEPRPSEYGNIALGGGGVQATAASGMSTPPPPPSTFLPPMSPFGGIPRHSASGSYAGRLNAGSLSGWEDGSKGGSLAASRRPSETGGALGLLPSGVPLPGMMHHHMQPPPGSGFSSRRGSEFGGSGGFQGRISEYGGSAGAFAARHASQDGSVFMFQETEGAASASKIPFSVSRAIGAGPLLPLLPALYVAGFVLLELYCSGLHPLLLGKQLPFVPLMLTSMYCALGVGWVWARIAWGFLTGRGYC